MKANTVRSHSGWSTRWIVLFLAVVGIGGPAYDLSAIPITNPGFETDAVADCCASYRINVTIDPNFVSPVATGWTLQVPSTNNYGDGVAAIQDLNPSYLVHNPDGSLSTTANDNNVFALGSANRISHQVGTLFAANVDYSLSLRAARLLTHGTFAGGRLILGYGTASSFTTLASVLNTDNSYALDTLPDATSGEWTTLTVNYSTGAGGSELGQNIVVAFAGNGVSGTPPSYVDDFVLVPEPTVSVLGAFGVTVLLWRRRAIG